MSRLFWLCLLALLLTSSVNAVDDLEGFEEEDEEVVTTETTGSASYTETKAQLQQQRISELIVQQETEVATERADQKAGATLWDLDEFEGVDGVLRTGDKKVKGAGGAQSAPRRRTVWKKQESYKTEIFGVVLLVLYLINVWWGKSCNEALALTWAQTFVTEGRVIEKNFALLGAGEDEEEDVLIKESHTCFKFYASGRRYCQGMLAVMDLKARQDFFSGLLYLIFPKKDTIDIDVYMNETDMLPMVCLLASPKHLKALLRENDDVRAYAREIPVKQISKWPLEKVHVWTESPDVFYDFMAPEVKNVFLSPEFEEVYERYFRYIYITSDYSHGSHKKVIKFSFNLPMQSKMAELSRWMSLMPLLIDLVAEYTPSHEAKKRAEKQRALESERVWKEGAEQRKEAFQQKKAEEKQAEMERIRRLSPAEQQKWLEKQQKLKQRRSVKVKTLKA